MQLEFVRDIKKADMKKFSKKYSEVNRMSHIGIDYEGQYTYYDIIDYDRCCTCEHFYDNWYETRFECSCKRCLEKDH